MIMSFFSGGETCRVLPVNEKIVLQLHLANKKNLKEKKNSMNSHSTLILSFKGSEEGAEKCTAGQEDTVPF